MKRSRSCAACGKPLVAGADRRTKYCKRRACIRARARGRKQAERGDNVVDLSKAKGEEGDPAANGVSISVYTATLAELAAAGKVDTSIGQTALKLALRLDGGVLDTGSSLASVSKQLQALMIEAKKGVKVPDDPVDELAQRRKKRQASG